MTQFETPGRDVPFPGATGISDQVCFASSQPFLDFLRSETDDDNPYAWTSCVIQ